jgi:NAD(P)H:quinone oxidoreductase type IV
MDKLSVMHAFRRIVERGSFARAAEDLGVSPALLSREIKLLEESLGTTLLTRTTRSMSLTDAGRLYYDEATGILDAVAGVETRIRDGAGAVRGHLKVNASSSFGQTVIAPILPGFLEAYPDLRLTLSMDDRVVDMVEGGFDVSIRIRPAMPDSALVARRIGTMRQRIFAAPADLEAYDAIVFGTPTLFGMMAGQMKSFLDQAGGLWARNALVGKVAAVFASTGSQHGGHEATLLSTQIPLQHFGMLIAGMPYTFAGQTTAEGIVGGAPYGAGTIAGADGSRAPTETDLAGARFQGAHVARIAARLAGADLNEEAA